MAAYLVVEVFYEDPAWLEAYRTNVPALIARHGGRYVARANPPETMEHDGRGIPDTVAIIEYPDADAARAMLADPDYRPFLEARQAGAKSRIFLI